VLCLEANQHQGNGRYGSYAPCDPERLKLFAGHGFDHPLKFFEVRALVIFQLFIISLPAASKSVDLQLEGEMKWEFHQGPQQCL